VSLLLYSCRNVDGSGSHYSLSSAERIELVVICWRRDDEICRIGFIG
jgi:hypothetical protein